jgi:hypothetical protein
MKRGIPGSIKKTTTAAFFSLQTGTQANKNAQAAMLHLHTLLTGVSTTSHKVSNDLNY